MKVKGSVVKSIKSFIENKFPEKYEVWLNRLPHTSKTIYDQPVIEKEWYPIQESVIQPTEIMAEMFFSSVEAAAWSSGRFSADVALKGIYSFFVLISTPTFIIDRGQNILPTFYDPTQLNVVESDENSMTIHVTQFPICSTLLEYRIGGWIERAMEISGCATVKVDILKSLAKGDNYTEYAIQWEYSS